MAEQKRPAFKVLLNGKSFHGGSMDWSLPTQNSDGSWTPGDWHEVAGPLACCSNGLHLTTEPARWWQDGAVLYSVEYEGDTDRECENDEKFAVRRCRLLSPAEWEPNGVVVSGVHQVRQGFWRAYGSATVRASDSATVEAYDSATVEAYDSATVEAYDSATVIRSGEYWRSHRGVVKLADYAAAVDRRNGAPVMQVAPFSDFPEASNV